MIDRPFCASGAIDASTILKHVGYKWPNKNRLFPIIGWQQIKLKLHFYRVSKLPDFILCSIVNEDSTKKWNGFSNHISHFWNTIYTLKRDIIWEIYKKKKTNKLKKLVMKGNNIVWTGYFQKF